MAGRATTKAEVEKAAVVRTCSTEGCQGKPLAYSARCQTCDTRERQAKSDARCRELGLTTVDEKRAFCKRLAKSLGRGITFETWAANISQRAIDLMVVSNGDSDRKALDRLRALAAVDDDNRLIPVEHRAEVRAAREAKVKGERERVEQLLAAQGVVRRDIDTEAR